MRFSFCDTDISLINLRKALLSCVLRLCRLALEDDLKKYKLVAVQILCMAGPLHCVDCPEHRVRFSKKWDIMSNAVHDTHVICR
jgi:hypothetical protein